MMADKQVTQVNIEPSIVVNGVRASVAITAINETDNPVKVKRRKIVHRNHDCDTCGKSFTQNGHLATHKRIHTGEKPFKCDICLRCFNDNSHMTRHKFIHTGEKPFECDVCKKSFTTNASLIRHKRIHTGNKPYKCHVCGRSFSQNITTYHKRTHTGEKPFECDLCSKRFTVNSNLTTHKKTHRISTIKVS